MHCPVQWGGQSIKSPPPPTAPLKSSDQLVDYSSGCLPLRRSGVPPSFWKMRSCSHQSIGRKFWPNNLFLLFLTSVLISSSFSLIYKNTMFIFMSVILFMKVASPETFTKLERLSWWEILSNMQCVWTETLSYLFLTSV